jgi:hypothetical protein
MNPAQYTVSSEAGGYFWGKTLREVLGQLWMKYNEVRLTETVHDLGDSETDSLTLASTVKQVTIKAVCSPSAVNCQAEIRLMSAVLTLSGGLDGELAIEFKSVVLEGKYALVNDCQEDSCTYCPFVLDEINNFYFDDKYNKYTGRPSWPACQSNTLVFIKASRVTLTDVRIQNFRQGYKALIEADHAVRLTNVSFDNVNVDGNAGAAVVNLRCSSSYVCSCEYKGGSVTRLNNGYELLKTTSQAGFLSLINVTSVEIQEVSFAVSTVYHGSSLTSSSPPLIYIENCKGTTTLQQLTFDTLVLSSGIVSVKATQIKYPDGQTIRERGILLAAAHIKLTDFKVTSVSCEYLLLVEFGSFLQNIDLEGLTVSDSAVTSSAISVSKPASPSSEEVQGGVAYYKTASFEATLKVPNYFTLEKSSFSRTYWSDSLVKLINLANIRVQNVQVTMSGGYSGELQEFAYDKLRVSPNIYASDSRIWAVDLKCRSAFSISTSSKGSFADIDFSQSKCSGVFGLEVTAFKGQVRHKQLAILNWTFSYITSDSPSSSLMYFNAMQGAELVIDSVYADSITSDNGRGAISFIDGSLTVRNSKFKGVHALATGGLYLELISTAMLDGLEFEDVTSIASYGGCINISFTDYSAFLSVLSSKFTQCLSKRSGGALFIDYAPVSLVLVVRDSVFERNESLINGSAIYSSNTVSLTETSSIDSCKFIKNVTANKGVIYFALNSSIVFTNLQFIANTGGICTCSIYHEKSNLTVSMRALKFLSNSSKNILCFEGSGALSAYTIEDSHFEDNRGYTSYVLQTSLILRGMKMLGNSNPFSFSTVYAQMTDLEVTDNFSSESASAFEIFDGTVLSCKSCKFSKNKGLTGTIKAESNSMLSLEDCEFTENSSTDSASVLYIVNSQRANSLKRCSVTSNSSDSSGTINLIESKLVLDSVLFKLNSAYFNSAGVIAQSSVLVVHDCDFSDQTAEIGAFLVATSDSALEISRSTFRRGRSVQGGGVSAVQSSNITMTDCVVSDIWNQAGGAIKADSKVEVRISSTSFSHVRTETEGSAIEVYAGSLSLVDVEVVEFYGTALYAAEMTEVLMQNVSITCKT